MDGTEWFLGTSLGPPLPKGKQTSTATPARERIIIRGSDSLQDELKSHHQVSHREQERCWLRSEFRMGRKRSRNVSASYSLRPTAVTVL